MRRTRTMMTLVLILMVIGPALAGEALDKTTPLAIIESLTSQSRKTWIPAGTILAKHREYRAAQTANSAEISKEIERQLADYRNDPRPEVGAELQKMRVEAIPFNVRYWMSNEYTMDSSVVVRYDGDRYYWEINVESRSDSVTLPSELRGNDMTEQFNLEWNRQRVFAYDGAKYTTYAGPIDQAKVDAAGSIAAPAVGGPLTAGVVPWGYGPLTYKNLTAATISTAGISRDGIDQIEMTVDQADGSSAYFVLDPSKDHAVTMCILPSRSNTVMTTRHYSGYQRVTGNWVPTTVVIERRDAFTDKLLSSDKWDFTVVDGSVPGPDAFAVQYGADTVIEYHSPVSTESLTYNYSNMADTDGLLAERLTRAATKSKRPQNCATAALKCAVSQLGKPVSDSVLTRLVRPDGQTTLYDLKQAAQGLGLHCRAVQTDIATLRDLPGCVAILHIPGKNHFVVLDHVDDRYAWLVDLSSKRFYYRTSVDLLPMDWPQGTALLLSNQPIRGTLRDIRESDLTSIVGAVEGWDCTHLLQEAYYISCTDAPGGCVGWLRAYYTRYGCEAAPGATCVEQYLWRMFIAPCYQEPLEPCQIELSDVVFYFMKACS